MTLSEAVPVRARGAIQALAEFSWSRQQRKCRGLFIDPQPATTALDLFDFYYRRSMPSEVYHYFSCRFAQPRHLVGLSLASLLPTSKKPILDLACGVGHFMHYWLKSDPGQQVVGVDRNFFQLYIAKHCVAPGGEFVCSDADVRLPFVSNIFCGVFCSDAFHCFLRRLQCAGEMKRVVETGGLIILSRFGNSQVEPREGYELTADGYLRLFDGLHTRMVSEQNLLEDYLAGRGPQLEKQAKLTDLTTHKWLCLIASDDQNRLRNYGGFQAWPHGVGMLKLNPLYHEKGTDASGKITVEFEFPSSWYEFENSGCLRYMPKTAELTAKILDDMKAGIRSLEMEKLIRQCVVIGMPERYS
jgi:ubiquinone/menaquinone biosynthesis C-methylase UbiE